MSFYLLTVLSFLFIISNTLSQKRELSIDDIYSNRGLYEVSLSEIHWFDEGNKFSFLKYDTEANSIAIYQHNVNTGEEIVLLTEKELNQKNNRLYIRHYEWSPDNKYILFTDLLYARDIKTGGSFYLYNLEKKEITIAEDSADNLVNIQFSPDGKNIGFVKGNNLFVVDIETGNEKQLTFDGSGEILNGVFDWVYEEEFSIIKGWEWSPDSRSIAFWRLDQSNVPKVYIPDWDSLYFKPTEQHYPKAGGNISSVKIGVVDINTSNVMWMDIGDNEDIYIPRIKFTADPDILSIQRLNRPQNKLDLLFADTKTGESKPILTETDTAWVDVWDNLRFLNDGSHFIWSSERDGYHHLYFYDMSGKMISQVTKGEWEIDNLISVDEPNKIIYYTSSERAPIYRDLYSINFEGSNKKQITQEIGDHAISMSPNNKYFIDEYSDANTLPSTILYDVDGKEIRKIINADMSAFEEFKFSPVEFLKFMTSDGVELNAAMIKPPDFDPSNKYPILIYNYSGPGSQVVLDKWKNPLWFHVLAQKGYIIFWLDNRGTEGRGKSFKNIMYKNLGYWEINDMIEAAEYLSSTGYVDPERIGIYGASYGGYVAALTILNGSEYFKAAVAVAPVTDWKFYDAIYTERYMQTPELNPAGYNKSSALNYANKLKGKLLLIHGTADDNVHLQNSIALTEELIKAGKQFDMMFYPGLLHGGFGKHYLNLMTDFILKNL